VSHAISQVEECGVARVYDLQVEDDHCFVAEGIICHNCLIIDDAIKSTQDALSERAGEFPARGVQLGDPDAAGAQREAAVSDDEMAGRGV
jgi:hypothetical protein